MIRTGSLFSQILSLFHRPDFARHVADLKAQRHSRGFSCWSQFVAMLFCQLVQARSLREISDGLKSCEGKLQHLGLESEPKRATLSYANAHRPWPLFERLFYDIGQQHQSPNMARPRHSQRRHQRRRAVPRHQRPPLQPAILPDPPAVKSGRRGIARTN